MNKIEAIEILKKVVEKSGVSLKEVLEATRVYQQPNPPLSKKDREWAMGVATDFMKNQVIWWPR